MYPGVAPPGAGPCVAGTDPTRRMAIATAVASAARVIARPWVSTLFPQPVGTPRGNRLVRSALLGLDGGAEGGPGVLRLLRHRGPHRPCVRRLRGRLDA